MSGEKMVILSAQNMGARHLYLPKLTILDDLALFYHSKLLLSATKSWARSFRWVVCLIPNFQRLVSLLRRGEYKYVFSLAQSNLHDIATLDLYKPTGFNLVSVQNGPVTALKIDDVRLDRSSFVTKLVHFCRVAELDDSVLLAGAWVLNGQVYNRCFSPEQPAGLDVQRDGLEDFFPLEDVQPPGLRRRRFSCFGRLVVFEHDAGTGDCICFSGQETAVAKVWLLLLNHFSVRPRRIVLALERSLL